MFVHNEEVLSLISVLWPSRVMEKVGTGRESTTADDGLDDNIRKATVGSIEERGDVACGT